MYDFSKTEAATAASYVQPGFYRLTPTEVKIGKFPKGTEYLGITFQNEDGESFTEKFGFGTEEGINASMKRLQHLHEGFFGKGCSKNFTKLSEIEAYFKKWLTGEKTFTKTMVVGGTINQKGDVYANLPFAGFFVEDEDVELGPFEEDSAQWKKYVKKSNQTSEVAGKSNGILNDADDDDGPGGKSSKKPGVVAEKPKSQKTIEKKNKNTQKDFDPDEDNGSEDDDSNGKEDSPW